MSDNGTASIDNTGAFEELFHWLLLEGIGILFLLAAFILIIAASIKLIRSNRIPGAKSIFVSIIFSLLGSITSVVYEHLAVETNLYVEAFLNIVLGVLFFIGAHGFWRLVRYSILSGTNHPINRTRADDARAG